MLLTYLHKKKKKNFQNGKYNDPLKRTTSNGNYLPQLDLVNGTYSDSYLNLIFKNKLWSK